MQQRVKDVVKRETFERFGLLGCADPDDFIDAQVVQTTYAAIRDAGAAGAPVRMVFASGGTQYRIEGVIKRS